MNEAPRQLPPPSNPALLPVLVAGTYLASVVALWGFLSLFLNREVIDYPDAGPLLGPAMVAAATTVTWIVGWKAHSWLSVVGAFVGSLAAMLLVGAVGYTLTKGDLSWMLQTSAHFALSPFVLGAAALSCLAILILRLATSKPTTGHTTP
jgi:hypothetical protein